MKSVSVYLAGRRQIKYILLSLVILVISDGVISQFLARHGLGYEGNPFLRTFVGEGYFLLLKVAGALLGALILWDISRRHPRLAFISSLFFVALYTGIVFWNLAVFFMGQV